jgi:hypothetical protein
MKWPAWLTGKRRKDTYREGGKVAPVDPQLWHELRQARKRLAEVEAMVPIVEQSDRRAKAWLTRNHLGPLFDQAFGAGK